MKGLNEEFLSHWFEFINNKHIIHNSLFSQNKLHIFSKTRGLKEPDRYLAIYLTDTTILA